MTNTPDTPEPRDSGIHSSSDADGDEALDPAAMLRLLETQQRSVAQQFGSFVWIITGTWGIAWLVGFGGLWLMDGLAPDFRLEPRIAFGLLGVLLAIAVLVSIYFGVRSNRGVKGSKQSEFTGVVYGSTWSIAMVGLWIFGSALISQGLSDEMASYYFTSAYVLMTGVMMLSAAAIWRAVPALVIGIWLVAIAAFSPLFGLPNHYLFLALAGGVAFLGLSIASLIYMSIVKRRAAGVHRG